MDEEDVGEFGIAPQRIQTTDDFGPNEKEKRKKRKLQSTQGGPIPGVPVLHLVLESCHDKAAVRLLKRMSGKFNDINSKPNPLKPIVEEATVETESESIAEESTSENADGRVYKCDMGPIKRRGNEDSDGDSSDFDYDHLEFEEDEFDALVNAFKDDRFGLNYVGLEKGDFFKTVGAETPIAQKHFTLFPDFSMVDQHNKKVSIKGQAFGVGAFEEDDEDIYARDDMSRYDFHLNEKKSERNRSNRLALTSASHFIDGFVVPSLKLSQQNAKKLFEVRLPHGFEPRNWLKRKSRFGPEITSTSTQSQSFIDVIKQVVGRHDMTPAQRGEILNEKLSKPPPSVEKEKPSSDDIDAFLKVAGLKALNFISETSKNKTTEDFSTFVKQSTEETNSSSTSEKSFIVPDSVPQIFDR